MFQVEVPLQVHADTETPGVVRDYAKLQALVYDILPWRKVPERDAGSVGLAMPDATRSSPEWFRSNVGGMWATSVL